MSIQTYADPEFEPPRRCRTTICEQCEQCDKFDFDHRPCFPGLIQKFWLNQKIYYLHEQAAETCNIELLKFLFQEYNVDPNTKFFEGMCALHFAAQEGDFETITFLLKWGADIDALTDDDWSPLQMALDADYRDIANYLTDYRDIANYLIDAGANVDGYNKAYGNCALDNAIIYGYVEIIEKICERTKDINSCDEEYGLTPLVIAGIHGKYDVMKILLSYGADPGIQVDYDLYYSPLETSLPLIPYLWSQHETQEITNLQQIVELLANEEEIFALRAERSNPLYHLLIAVTDEINFPKW